MRVGRVVVRSGVCLLVAVVMVTAWRAAHPPLAPRVAAQLAVTEDLVTDAAGEVAALRSHVAGTPIAIAPAEAVGRIDVSLQGDDADVVARTLADAISQDYLSRRAEARARRAAALLAETAAGITRQSEVTHRAERDRAAAQAQLARAWRDRALVATQLRSVERSLARVRERVAELQPLAAHLTSGGSVESLHLVQNMPFVQTLRARRADLESERAALLTRYGTGHPDVERNAQQIASVAGQLQLEMTNLSKTLMQDYQDARTEQAHLEAERTAALRVTQGPTPSSGEYSSLAQRVDAEQARLAQLVQRERQLAGIVERPGPALSLVTPVTPVEPMVPRPAPWPWALALLTALAAAFVAPSILRSLRPAA